MSVFRFVHAADLHLDTPFQGIARVAPDIAQAMRDASLEAWDALVRWTIEEDALFLLLAGDLYDGEERGVRAQLRFREGLERLSEHGVSTFIVHGNHDPLDGWSAIHHWPERTTVFGAGEVGTVPVERHGRRLATVYGISYAQRETTENLALRFRRGRAAGLHIGLLHCNVERQAGHAPYSPCTIQDLRAAGMDYWALGHVHKRQLRQDGGRWIVYPGNLQGRTPRITERQPKGAVVVEATSDRVVDVRFQELDRIRFHHAQIDISPCNDLFAVKQGLIEAAQVARHTHGERGIILIATLRGRTPIHADLARSGVLDELLAELRSDFEGDSPFLWWDHLRDRTRAPFNLQAIRERDDFFGALLRKGDELVADPARLQQFIERQEHTLWSQRLPDAVSRELLSDAPAALGEHESVFAGSGAEGESQPQTRAAPARPAPGERSARARRDRRQPSLFEPPPAVDTGETDDVPEHGDAVEDERSARWLRNAAERALDMLSAADHP